MPMAWTTRLPRATWCRPRAVSVPLKFQREGIKYAELSEDERDQWDALEWDDEGGAPDEVGAEAVNKWLFNTDTVDKVLKLLMTRGHKVAGGDRLGKTIVFAKNNAHAEFIAQRFNANYPHYAGQFARVITFKTEYAQSLIDDFSVKDKAPHIAISVDMLDTGIDVPEVVNLVFFKIVRSKAKFWQMVGRGTRLCKDLFGPGQDKKDFLIFDFCQNLEYFSQNLGHGWRRGQPLGSGCSTRGWNCWRRWTSAFRQAVRRLKNWPARRHHSPDRGCHTPGHRRAVAHHGGRHVAWTTLWCAPSAAGWRPGAQPDAWERPTAEQLAEVAPTFRACPPPCATTTKTPSVSTC
jgi:type I restriction enzyme R subunit